MIMECGSVWVRDKENARSLIDKSMLCSKFKNWKNHRFKSGFNCVL